MAGLVARLTACGPSDGACGCDDTRFDTEACTVGEPLCVSTRTTEYPGNGEQVRTWSGDPAACALSAFRDRVPGWISLTLRDVGEGTESPGHATDVVEIRDDGSFRASVDHSDDSGDSRALEEGLLRAPAHFDACMPATDDLACLLDYADPASVEREECS